MGRYSAVVGILAVMLWAGGAVAKEASTVTCQDGTTAKAGRGACSHHGGVAKGDTGGAATTDKAAADKAEGAAGSVTCKDGSTAKAGRGACSHHGGVAGGAAAPAEKAEAPAETHHGTAKSKSSGDESGAATAKCKDGTLSHSAHHSGTCSRHGGVAEWLDGSGH